ncbi:MAG: carbohydrate kinase family protein [Lachnospiraceae bacterium]
MDTKIAVAGHICIDITPIFPQNKTLDISKILIPGKLINMDAVDIHTGGVVANTGLALLKLGADVKLVGKIGTDEFGNIINDILEKYNANTYLIKDNKSTTSYSIVIAIPCIDRIFLHDPGANHTFSEEEISETILGGIHLFHFGYPTIMRKMYLENGKEIIKLFQKVKKLGIITSLDLAAIDGESEASKIDWEEILRKLLPSVDIFVPSFEELCFILDRERYKKLLEKANGKDLVMSIELEDIQYLAEKTMSLGCHVLLIKCGELGIYYKTSNYLKLNEMKEKFHLNIEEWEMKEGFQTSYIPNRICSATGAGDTSIATFLYALTKGYNLSDCVMLAAAQGASCVEEYDALGGLKTLEELKEKIERGWKKNDCKFK